MQILVYNHGLLALWAPESVVLVADLDEFLTTSKRGMTAKEVHAYILPWFGLYFLDS